MLPGPVPSSWVQLEGGSEPGLRGLQAPKGAVTTEAKQRPPNTHPWSHINFNHQTPRASPGLRAHSAPCGTAQPALGLADGTVTSHPPPWGHVQLCMGRRCEGLLARWLWASSAPPPRIPAAGGRPAGKGILQQNKTKQNKNKTKNLSSQMANPTSTHKSSVVNLCPLASWFWDLHSGQRDS